MYHLVTRAQCRVWRTQSVLNFYNSVRARAFRYRLDGPGEGNHRGLSRLPPAKRRVLAAQRPWVTACRFSSEASMAAAVARGCSMGKRWLPSSIMVRPWVTRCVMAMPT